MIVSNYRFLIILCVLILGLAGCGGEGGGEGGTDTGGEGQLGGQIAIDGSSTVFPITAAVAEEFNLEHSDVRVGVSVSGTGGGFKRFCAGEIAISNASRPIEQSEIESCQQQGIEFIELPVAYDGIAVVTNLQNDWTDCLTVADLKKMWEPAAQGKINNWNQVRSEWPNQDLHLYGPGTDSGTFDYFTEALVGESGASRGDYTASEDDNVLVQGVSNDPGGLAYFGFAYYSENQGNLKVLGIDNGQGCVQPSEETISDGSYQPLSRPVFIYISKAALDRPEVAAFAQFYLEQVPTLAAETGYVALSERVYELAQGRVESKTTGSIFGGGSEVGVSLEELLQREGK